MGWLERLGLRPQHRRAPLLALAAQKAGFELTPVEDLGDTIAFRRDRAGSALTGLFAALALFLVVGLWFGSFAKQETMRGQVTASSGAKRVTATVGGIVSRVWVRQGEIVAAGQKLVTIEPQQSSAGADSLIRSDIAALEAERANLAAEQERIDTLLSRDQGDRDRFFADDGALRETLEEQELRLVAAIETQGVIVEKFERYLRRGYATRQQLLAEERAELDYVRQLGETRIQLSQLSTTTTERQRGLQRSSTETLNARSTLTSRIAEIGARLERLKADIATDILAPSDGEIATLNITEGSIADAGEVVAAIVDPGAAIRIVLEAPSSTIGLIEPGQRVVLKYDAFPYKTFGVQYGTVRRVGEAPLSLPKTLDPATSGDPLRPAQSTFLVEVEPERTAISAYGEDRPLVIGSTLSADVVVERRRLIDWVLDPILAMRGRL